MQTLMIVEDEVPFRDGIVSMIDWPAHGIQLSAAVSNGQEAWALIQRCPPDLVLTDIRMPVMDGLELLGLIKQAGLPTHVILLSGHSEFEYAKQALRLGAFDYILKPCRPEEILATLRAAIQSGEQRQQSWRLAGERLLAEWLQAPAPPDGPALLQRYQLSITDAPLQVGLLHGSPETSAGALVQEMLGPLYQGHLESFPYGEDWLWVGNVPDSLDDALLGERLRDLRERLRAESGAPVWVGVGSIQPDLAHLHLSYGDARRALALREDQPQQGIFLFTEMTASPSSAEGALIDPEMTALEASILQQMQTGRYAQAIDGVELWLEHLRRHPEYSRRQVGLRAASLLLGLQRITQVQSLPLIRWKEQLIEGITLLPTIQSIDELATVMTRYMQHLVSILTPNRPLHRTVQAALKIVAAQYKTNLTLEAVAREVFVSTSYLSTLFKQELGINFLDYLHQYRVERAKELLAREPLKIFAVARLVGYQDERHFSSTFKKWTGVSPSQYQKSVTPM